MIKTDSAGNTKWTKTFGGADFDAGSSVRQTSDSGYAVAGITNSFRADNNYHFYVIKMNTTGTLQWSRTIGGANADDAYSIIQTIDGGYVVAGWTNSFGSSAYDIYVVKLDANGNTCANSTSPSSIVTNPTVLLLRILGGTNPIIRFNNRMILIPTINRNIYNTNSA